MLHLQGLALIFSVLARRERGIAALNIFRTIPIEYKNQSFQRHRITHSLLTVFCPELHLVVQRYMMKANILDPNAYEVSEFFITCMPVPPKIYRL